MDRLTRKCQLAGGGVGIGQNGKLDIFIEFHGNINGQLQLQNTLFSVLIRFCLHCAALRLEADVRDHLLIAAGAGNQAVDGAFCFQIFHAALFIDRHIKNENMQIAGDAHAVLEKSRL